MHIQGESGRAVLYGGEEGEEEGEEGRCSTLIPTNKARPTPRCGCRARSRRPRIGLLIYAPYGKPRSGDACVGGEGGVVFQGMPIFQQRNHQRFLCPAPTALLTRKAAARWEHETAGRPCISARTARISLPR